MDLSGRTVVVTGAARGIGAACARAFAAAGARVALWGRTAAPLDALAAGIGGGAFGVAADVTDTDAVEAAMAATLARAGRVHVVVNNAGTSGEARPFLDMTEAAWSAMLDVNLAGPMRVSRAAARHMAGAGGGVILMNASIAARAVDGAFSHYAASKAGLLALMRNLAVELAPFGIRCNAVSPGYTRTDMTMRFFPPEQAAFLEKGFVRAPIQRIVEPAEVAAALVFLASDAASGITGTEVTVDGGLTANHYIMETFARPRGGPPHPA